MTRRLHAVDPDEAPPVPLKRKTVAEAIAGGDVREQLVAMRDRLVRAFEDPKAPTHTLAPLSKRITDITAEITAIDAAAEQEGDGAEVPDEAFDSSAI